MKTEALPEFTREGLEALQLERLNDTLKRVGDRGGFYKGLPRRLECLSDLQKLPFTTAEDLSAQPGKFLLTSQSEISRVISGATSGTTGPAKRVFYTRQDTEHTIGFFAAGISEMLSPGERCFIAFPFTGPFGLGDLIAKAVERLGAVAVKAGFGQSWGEMLELVKATRPEAYIGFPVTLLGLLRLYGEGFPIRRALVSGDACPEGVMGELEQALGSRLYPHYGSRECGLGGAVTCPAHQGMHIRENHILPEIIDEQGNVLPDGEYGELVITTIGAEAMPLIRYRTGDVTRILPPCPCGGVSRRIDRVSRREGEGAMERLDSALFPVKELVDYRAVLRDTLTIEARMLDLRGEAELRHALQRCCPGLPVTLATEVCQLSEAPLYPGKRQILTK